MQMHDNPDRLKRANTSGSPAPSHGTRVYLAYRDLQVVVYVSPHFIRLVASISASDE